MKKKKVILSFYTLLENSAFPDVVIIVLHQYLERCFSLHVWLQSPFSLKLEVELCGPLSVLLLLGGVKYTDVILKI